MFNLISRLRIVIFFVLSPILITSCSTTGYYRHYQGGLKPLSDVAIIVQMDTSTVNYIDYIDGRYIGPSGNFGPIVFPDIQELSSGNHDICTGFTKSLGGSEIKSSKGCVNIKFNAEPGHVYYFYPKVKTHDKNWEPAYWDITGELHAPELKDLVSRVDTILAKNRKDKSLVSILSLATKQSISSLVGFGEELKSNLNKWLNKNITVRYKFNRYVPYIMVEADDGIEYHLEIDQKTGFVNNVLGKNIAVEGKLNTLAFQPLNSKFAYQHKWGGIKWEEQKDGSYIKVK